MIAKQKLSKYLRLVRRSSSLLRSSVHQHIRWKATSTSVLLHASTTTSKQSTSPKVICRTSTEEWELFISKNCKGWLHYGISRWIRTRVKLINVRSYSSIFTTKYWIVKKQKRYKTSSSQSVCKRYRLKLVSLICLVCSLINMRGNKRKSKRTQTATTNTSLKWWSLLRCLYQVGWTKMNVWLLSLMFKTTTHLAGSGIG